jgi:hypothetical protein
MPPSTGPSPLIPAARREHPPRIRIRLPGKYPTPLQQLEGTAIRAILAG